MPHGKSLLDSETELVGLRRAAYKVGIAPEAVSLPQRKRFEHDGGWTNYYDWGGPGPRRPEVVFLHGGRLTAHTWDLVCLALRGQFRCLAMDLRGHGDSSWSPDGRYSIPNYAEDLRALISHEHLDELAIVGHSLGGVVAAYFGTLRPPDLRGLVLVDAAPMSGPKPESQRISEFADLTMTARTLEDFVAHAVRFDPRRDPATLRYTLLHNLRMRGDGGLEWKYDRAPYDDRSRDRYEDHTQVWRDAQLIEVPTLLVRGGASPLTTDAEVRALARRVPNCSVVTVANAGHSVHGDQPRELTDAVCAFLRSAWEGVGAGAS